MLCTYDLVTVEYQVHHCRAMSAHRRFGGALQGKVSITMSLPDHYLTIAWFRRFPWWWLLSSILPFTTHKLHIGVSLDTTRYACSHLQHLLNIPTLHQLQASEIRWRLEFNPKEVGHAYLFSPLSLLLLFSRSQFSSVHVISDPVTCQILLLSLSYSLFFFLVLSSSSHISALPTCVIDPSYYDCRPLYIRNLQPINPRPKKLFRRLCKGMAVRPSSFLRELE